MLYVQCRATYISVHCESVPKVLSFDEALHMETCTVWPIYLHRGWWKCLA